jgi:hypothetical protein
MGRLALALLLALTLAGCTGSDPHAGAPAAGSGAAGVFPVEDPAANPPANTTASYVHWHATLQLWVEGQRVRFQTADGRFYYDVNREAQYLPAHIHACNPDLVHNEASTAQPGRLVDLFDHDFAFAGGHLNDTALVVPQGAPLAGPHVANATDMLALYVSHDNGSWMQESSIAGYAFHDHDRILLVFGHDDAATVRQRADAFPLFSRAQVC